MPDSIGFYPIGPTHKASFSLINSFFLNDLYIVLDWCDKVIKKPVNSLKMPCFYHDKTINPLVFIKGLPDIGLICVTLCGIE